MINTHILDRYGPKAREWLTGTIMGQMLWNKVLNVKGLAVFITGMPDSGKTRKMHWLVSWLKELEVIVWIDSCKDEEIAPLFLMGKPVNIIIPHGMKIEIIGLGDNFRVQHAFMPDQVWDLIDPGSINIISIKQYFLDGRELVRFYAAMFRSLIIRASEEFFRDTLKIKRMSVLIDEAQRIVPSQSITADRDALEVAQLVTTNVLETRAYGIRIVTGTQDYQSIHPIARRNMPARIFCHGSSVRSDESKRMHKLAEYSQEYHKSEGLFVMPDGDYFPRVCPWKFPDYPKPDGARIRYIGKVDRHGEDVEELELSVDLGRYAALAIQPADKVIAIPHSTSFGGIPNGDLE